MEKNIFIKHYNPSGPFIDLPANSYWLLREESILSYLSQRGMSVPKVYLKNIEEQSITLEHVGISFDKLFISSNKESAIHFFQYIHTAVNELIKIFNSGILHLDIAARNICLNKNLNNKVFILDFSHCISSNYVLQKPIPLLPQENIQHPMLVEALKKDWSDFYCKSGLEVPNLDQNFDVDNNLFSNYWVDDLYVQKLQNSFAVLSHSVGQFYLEMSAAQILSKDDKIFLINLGQNLRFNEESFAESNLHQSLRELENYSPTTSKVYPSETQIPNVVADQGEGATSQSLIKKFPQNQIVQKKFDTNTSQLKSTPVKGKDGIFFFLFIWFLLLSNGYWIDFVVTETKLILSDWVIYLLIIMSFCICIIFLLSIFKKNFLEKISTDILYLFFFIEAFLTAYLFSNFYNHSITWLPSLLVSILIFILYLYKKLIKNHRT